MGIAIPNLPTDNLYKFVALSGVFIFVTSCWFMLTSVHALENLTLVIEAEQNQANAIEDLLPPISVLLSDNKSEDIELFKEWVEKTKEIEVQKNTIEIHISSLKDYFWPFILMLLVSLLMIIKGFTLWSKRVQEPLDEILQLNLKKARQEFYTEAQDIT